MAVNTALMEEGGITAGGISVTIPVPQFSVGCRLRNGGQEVEESGLIVPISPSHQIPSSAGRQLSWFCQFTVISQSQRQLDQDCSEAEFVHTLLAAVQSLIDRPVIFFAPPLTCFLSITPESHTSVRLVLKDSSWEV